MEVEAEGHLGVPLYHLLHLLGLGLPQLLLLLLLVGDVREGREKIKMR